MPDNLFVIARKLDTSKGPASHKDLESEMTVTAYPPEPCEPWVIFEYEEQMFRDTTALLRQDNEQFQHFPKTVRNAVVESALLHTRQLCNILLSRGPEEDDINLDTLIGEKKPPALPELDRLYGDENTKGCPCWTINQKILGATTHRHESENYDWLLSEMVPAIQEIVKYVRFFRSHKQGTQ